MSEDAPGKSRWVKLIGVVVALIVLLPPAIMMSFNMTPALWLESFQAKTLSGRYLPKLTFCLLAMANAVSLLFLACVVALIVKLTTGKTVEQLFQKGAQQRLD